MSPLVCAHRGSCGVPGLPAAERYRRAIELGVDYVELDVRRTLDGLYVNYHDDVTPSGRPAESLTYAALKDELGSELLLLDELFDVVGGRVGLHIDLKEAGYETEIGLYAFRELISRGAVDIVQLDIAWSGGFSEGRRIAAYAGAHHRMVAPHAFAGAVLLVEVDVTAAVPLK